jgi:uncharacterized membrane protein
MKLKNLPWIPFAFFAIVIGLYPLTYYLVDMHNQGLLSGKPKALVNNNIWYTTFYVHITFGGIAMLTGWTQFSQKLRNRYLKTHRLVGKIYVISVIISSCAGLYIAFFATGGIISAFGLGTLALLWLITVIKAYTSIRRLDITEHQKWMIRNYALTFAAVTLRVYLPLFLRFIFHDDFITSFRIISWLCWIPNLIVAEIIISKMRPVRDMRYEI